MILETYKTVSCEAHEEFTEKKSVFIGHAKPIENEEEALEYISFLNKKYDGAAHNCYAYTNKEQNVVRFSDNGEPQGTAGMPILEVIKREELCGIVIVVTRFFGGILLGTGGLSRAYSKAAKIAIESAGISIYCRFIEFRIQIDYSLHKKLMHEFEKHKIRCKNTEFGENVVLTLIIRQDRYNDYSEYLRDISGGKIKPYAETAIYDIENL